MSVSSKKPTDSSAYLLFDLVKALDCSSINHKKPHSSQAAIWYADTIC